MQRIEAAAVAFGISVDTRYGGWQFCECLIVVTPDFADKIAP